jgi:hypothetical protein
MTRKTVTVEATELLTPDVKYISLVKRGANRIPFRITKSENDSMINLDLSRIFKREKPPTVLAVVVNKAEVSEETTSIIKEAGFSVEDVIVQDGCTIFKQHATVDGAIALKMDENVALLVDADSWTVPVTKAEESWANEFYEAMQCDGYWATYSGATSYLTWTLSKALYAAKSAEEARSSAAEVIGAYSDYVLGMVGAIPASAFAMGEAVAKSLSEPGEGETTEPPTSETEVAEKSDGVPGDEGEGEATETDPAEEVSKNDDPAGDGTGVEDPEAEVPSEVEASADEAGMASVSKALAEMTQMIQDLPSQLAEMSEVIKSIQKENLALKDKIESVEVIAKSATSVVLGSESPDDTMTLETSAKTDSFEVIDTAFQPNIRKSARTMTANSRQHRSLSL